MPILPILLAVTVATPPLPPLPQRPFAELKPAATLVLGKTADWVQVADGSVWVAASGPFALYRIEPGAAKVIATIPLPGVACAGLAVGFGAVWAPICGDKPALARIDTATNALTLLPGAPGVEEGGLAASEDSLWIPADHKGGLQRVDPKDGHVRQTVQVCEGGENPLFAAGIVWITCNAGAGVDRVDARDGRLLGHIATGPKPRFLASDGRSVWTLNQGDGSVTRIDIATAGVMATIDTRTPGHGGDIQAGGGKVWTTLADTPLTLIDAQTNRVERQWTGPGGDSLNFGFGAVWLTDYHKGLVQKFPVGDLTR